MVLAHDSRTLELATYHQIPHRLLPSLDRVDPVELYAEGDWEPMHRGHPALWERFAAFLGRHDLRHVFAPGENPQAFNDRLATTKFPAPVGTLMGMRPAELYAMKAELDTHAFALGPAAGEILTATGRTGATTDQAHKSWAARFRPMSGWAQISRSEVLRRRLAVQRLTTPGLPRAADVVELLACVQSQEWAHGFWSLGMRTGATPDQRSDYRGSSRPSSTAATCCGPTSCGRPGTT